MRKILSVLFGKEIDQTTLLFPPFYTDFGLNTKIGKNAVIAAGSVVTKRCGTKYHYWLKSGKVYKNNSFMRKESRHCFHKFKMK